MRTEPTVRQTQAILTRIERELVARGARVERAGASALRFAMAHPWRARKLDALTTISAGRVLVSAGSGEPRRVRYVLGFRLLRAVAAAASIILLVWGWEWPRPTLLNALLALWVVIFGAPYAVAERRFRRLLETAAHDVIERRQTTGETPVPDVPAVKPGRTPPDA
jgi:hypothetical protein